MTIAADESLLPTRRPAAYYLRPGLILRTLRQNRQLIWRLVRRNVAARYRGSFLGMLWSFMVPLLLLAVYTFVFSVVFEIRWGVTSGGSSVEFALMLFCGLMLYNLFAETLTGCTPVIVSHTSYVKKVVFPLEVLPVVVLGEALINATISLGILLVGIAAFLHHLPPTALYYPLIVLPLLMFCLGLGWFLASTGVYIRDTTHAVGVVLQMLFFLTPLFYPLERIPEAFRLPIQLNPLTMIVENARRVLVIGQAPDWTWLVAMIVFGAVTMQLGFAWFMKTRRGFADVL